jgi:hypothetical protein
MVNNSCRSGSRYLVRDFRAYIAIGTEPYLSSYLSYGPVIGKFKLILKCGNGREEREVPKVKVSAQGALKIRPAPSSSVVTFSMHHSCTGKDRKNQEREKRDNRKKVYPLPRRTSKCSGEVSP